MGEPSGKSARHTKFNTVWLHLWVESGGVGLRETGSRGVVAREGGNVELFYNLEFQFCKKERS